MKVRQLCFAALLLTCCLQVWCLADPVAFTQFDTEYWQRFNPGGAPSAMPIQYTVVYTLIPEAATGARLELYGPDLSCLQTSTIDNSAGAHSTQLDYADAMGYSVDEMRNGNYWAYLVAKETAEQGLQNRDLQPRWAISRGARKFIGPPAKYLYGFNLDNTPFHSGQHAMCGLGAPLGLQKGTWVLGFAGAEEFFFVPGDIDGALAHEYGAELADGAGEFECTDADIWDAVARLYSDWLADGSESRGRLASAFATAAPEAGNYGPLFSGQAYDAQTCSCVHFAAAVTGLSVGVLPPWPGPMWANAHSRHWSGEAGYLFRRERFTSHKSVVDCNCPICTARRAEP